MSSRMMFRKPNETTKKLYILCFLYRSISFYLHFKASTLFHLNCMVQYLPLVLFDMSFQFSFVNALVRDFLYVFFFNETVRSYVNINRWSFNFLDTFLRESNNNLNMNCKWVYFIYNDNKWKTFKASTRRRMPFILLLFFIWLFFAIIPNSNTALNVSALHISTYLPLDFENIRLSKVLWRVFLYCYLLCIFVSYRLVLIAAQTTATSRNIP